MKQIIKKINVKNKALFLDRDGVINRDFGHVYEIEKFELIDNIVILIKKAMECSYKIIVVTNQAGIGRKIYTIDQFKKITEYMKALLLKYDCKIDAVYYCPYHPTKGVGEYLKESFDRKPNPGMLLKAKKDFNIDMKKSIFIGDNLSDMKAGISSSVKTNILFNENKIKTFEDNQNNNIHKFLKINYLTEAIKYL